MSLKYAMCTVFYSSLNFFFFSHTLAEVNCSSFDSFIRWIFGIVLCARMPHSHTNTFIMNSCSIHIVTVDLKIHSVAYTTNTCTHAHWHTFTVHILSIRTCTKNYINKIFNILSSSRSLSIKITWNFFLLFRKKRRKRENSTPDKRNYFLLNSTILANV